MDQDHFNRLPADDVIQKFISLAEKSDASKPGIVNGALAELDQINLEQFRGLVITRLRAGDERLRRPFPWYELIVNGQSEFHPIRQAGRAYDSGFVPVSFGTRVLLEDGSTREMSSKERGRISELADEYSDSK